jgi:hypothetical protein
MKSSNENHRIPAVAALMMLFATLTLGNWNEKIGSGENDIHHFSNTGRILVNSFIDRLCSAAEPNLSNSAIVRMHSSGQALF